MKDHLGIYYDITSDFQQEQFNALRELIEESVKDKSALHALLDIGSGTGARTRQCLEIFPGMEKLVAVEPDWEMISVAQEKYADPRIAFKKMGAEDISALVAEGHQFDGILSNWALHWVADKQKMFNGLNAMTESGALMMFSTCERLPAILMMIDAYIRNEFRILPGNSPYHFLTLAEWTALLEQFGWEVTASKTYPVAREVDDAKEYLDHWFTASTAKFLYGRHMAELTPLTHNDLVWMMNRAFPSRRYEGGLAFQEDTMFVIARKK
jgi:trans-aconitate methyltransferase